MTKWKFVEDELIADSIGGAFQRANVYANPMGGSDPRRDQLRKSLADLLRELESQYATPVNGERHKANIQKIAHDLTSQFGKDGLLRKNKFRIGIAQKALNLFLKYLWCLGKVPTPPHCPFDAGIIAKLPLSDRQKKDLQWTKLDSLVDYQTLVDVALSVKTTDYPSLSDWELKQWKSDPKPN